MPVRTRLPTPTPFTEWLHARIDRWPTLAAFCDQAGLPYGTVSAWFHRGTKPQPDRLAVLAEFLGEDYGEVLERAGHPPLSKPSDPSAPELTRAERAVLALMREMDDVGQTRLLDDARDHVKYHPREK